MNRQKYVYLKINIFIFASGRANSIDPFPPTHLILPPAQPQPPHLRSIHHPPEVHPLSKGGPTSSSRFSLATAHPPSSSTLTLLRAPIWMIIHRPLQRRANGSSSEQSQAKWQDGRLETNEQNMLQ